MPCLLYGVCTIKVIHNNQLARNLSLPLPLIRGRVLGLDRLKMNPLNNPLNVRVVVDADHHFAFTVPHEVSHALVVFKREIHSVTSCLPVM